MLRNAVYRFSKIYEMAGFDQAAGEMGRAIPYMLDERIEKFRRYGFNVKGWVLDVGTGVGIDILALNKIGLACKFVGIDFSRKSLLVAKKKLSEVGVDFHLVRADCCFLPFNDGVFDGITTNNVVHHHPLDGLKQIFGEFKRVMRNDAVLLMNEPCIEKEECGVFNEMENFLRFLWSSEELLSSIPENLRKYLYVALPIFEYGGVFYPSIIRRLLNSLDFKIEKLEQTFPEVSQKWIFHEIENAIKHLKLKNEEKELLLNKIEEFKEKIRIVKAFKSSMLIVKARKPKLDESF